MPQYDNRNRGSLFKNDKDGVEARPDYRGQLDVDGVAYWVSAWIREAGPNSKMAGQKFMALEIKPKDAPAAAVAPTTAPTPTPTKHGFEDLEDDRPF